MSEETKKTRTAIDEMGRSVAALFLELPEDIADDGREGGKSAISKSTIELEKMNSIKKLVDGRSKIGG